MSADSKAPTISSDGISDAISKIMEHPELISMVASALSGNTDKSGSDSERTAEVAAKEESAEAEISDSDSVATGAAPQMNVNADLFASMMPMISKLSSLNTSGGKSGLSSKHEQLLCALKLYVSPSRCQAIDYILKFSQMSGLLRGLK